MEWARGFSSTSSQPSRSSVTTAMTGVYSVTVNNGGCSASATTSVSVNSSVVSATGNNVCSGGTINLSAAPSGGSYAWSVPQVHLAVHNKIQVEVGQPQQWTGCIV
ncbi:MAG: hypothetical protein U0Y10_02190 [Spirosomataceae bacterium]